MLEVAVVEDEELIRTMIRLNLETEGFNVSTFDSGEAFFERFDTQRFVAILLDISLPGMSGNQIIERIRAQGATTPILMVTARSDIHTKIDTFEKGADDYLAKPFDMEELVIRVKALIRRHAG